MERGGLAAAPFRSDVPAYFALSVPSMISSATGLSRDRAMGTLSSSVAIGVTATREDYRRVQRSDHDGDMSLTWGRRSFPDPRRLRPRVLLLICAAVATIASGVPDRSVVQPPSLDLADARGPIQGLFDLHRGAIERGDRVSYELTLDPRSPAFVACMRRQFDLGRARADALAPGRVVGLEHVAGTNVIRVRLEQRDGIGTHYVRRFLIGPVTAFPWLDLMRSVPAWYISYPDPDDPRTAGPLPGGAIEGSGCGRDGPLP